MERGALPLSVAHLGRALGLDPYRPFNLYNPRASFRELERARGKREAVGFEAKPRDVRWYSGEVDGRECMLVPYADTPGADANRTIAVVVRVHPPLHLGTWITKPGAWSFLERSEIHLGDSAADGLLLVEALEPAALEAMLRSKTRGAPASALRDALVDAVEEGAMVTDSAVTYHLPSFQHIRDVTDVIGRGAQLADALVAQRATLPELEFERSYRRRWAASAAARGLEFDPRALLVHGDVAGATVEIAVDVTPVKSHVTVTARWPRTPRDSTGAPLRMVLVPARQLGKLERWFGQDVRVGEKRFDDLFIVRGETAAEIQGALASAELQQALVSIGTSASAMMVNDRGAFWQLEGDAARADAIDAQLGAVERLAAALLGQARHDGPYR